MENRPISEARNSQSMNPGGLFRFCPSCGRTGIDWKGRAWHCATCGFEYFHNVATAAGLILTANDSCLFLRRAKEPRKGCLALPGGFVDPNEAAEEALLRECKEELGWAPQNPRFLASFPNTYIFQKVEYWTCDLFFCAKIRKKEISRLSPNPNEATRLVWIEVSAIPWESIAFESTRQALRQYLLKI